MRFDVIGSERGFNQSSLLASGLTADELGPFLATIMRVRDGTHWSDGDKDGDPRSAVTVHAHPTFWNDHKWVYDCRKENP